MYARGTEGGVVKPSQATFALTFATPCAVSPAQLVLPEGREGATRQSRHGHTHHIWNPACMESGQRESTSYGVQVHQPWPHPIHNPRFQQKFSDHPCSRTAQLSVEIFVAPSRNTKIAAVEINIAVE